ncbi:hypothetical protein Y032_0028g1757 [Ancylostoma ceylanicum]|uniref:Uncharacterized protein n=1 Tax=Ancylostoma ceylanicum TaxID=53326 RepID=A0A016UTV2_9BILA|nr:hypothetical protein Y032_0028g1757 [Ancylostoma ceylanicum]
MRTSYVITRTSNVIGNTTEVRRIATVEATVKSEKPDGVEEEHMEMSCLETMNLFLGLSMVNDVVFMHAYPLGKAIQALYDLYHPAISSPSTTR